MTEPQPGEYFIHDMPYGIFSHRFSLESYMRVRSRAKFGRTDWRKIYNSPESAIELWEHPRIQGNIYIWHKIDGFHAGFLDSGQYMELGVRPAHIQAEKLAYILKDFIGTMPFGKIKQIYETYKDASPVIDAYANIVTPVDRPEDREKAFSVKISEDITPTRKLAKDLIYRIYNKAFDFVNEKYPLIRPSLRVVENEMQIVREKRIDVGSRVLASYNSKTNTVTVLLNPENYPTVGSQYQKGIYDTIVHELAHAVVFQRFRSNEGHEYYFLNVYKVLSGRDYLKGQEELMKELTEREQRIRMQKLLEEIKSDLKSGNIKGG